MMAKKDIQALQSRWAPSGAATALGAQEPGANTLATLLAAVTAAGAQLIVRHGKLVGRGTAQLSPTLQEEIRARRREIIEATEEMMESSRHRWGEVPPADVILPSAQVPDVVSIAQSERLRRYAWWQSRRTQHWLAQRAALYACASIEYCAADLAASIDLILWQREHRLEGRDRAAKVSEFLAWIACLDAVSRDLKRNDQKEHDLFVA